MPDSEKNFAPEKNAVAFRHRESSVATRLGISRDTALDLRRRLLIEGAHWSHQARCIRLTDEAVQLLASGIRGGILWLMGACSWGFLGFSD